MERERVGQEAENANQEADKVSKIQNEVSRKQADAEAELAKAEPAVLAAMYALDTLDKSQLGQCKTMSVPPPGVADIFVACMVSVFIMSHSCGLPCSFVSPIQSDPIHTSCQGTAGEPQRQCCGEQTNRQGTR